MTEATLTSQPEPEHLAEASLALARVLAGDVDVDVRLAAGAALAVLSDVHPPYPPHPGTLEPLPVAEGASRARHALLKAAAGASVDSQLRIAGALRELDAVDAPQP